MKKIHTSNLVLLVIVILQFAFSQMLRLLDIRVSVPMALLWSQLILLVPFIGCCILTKKNPIKAIRLKKTKPVAIFFAIMIAFISYPVVIFLNMISMLFVDNAVADIMPTVLEMGLLPGLFFMAFLPAVIEETIFRGMLYNTYSKYRPGAGIILSAVLFGLMHMNFNQMPYAIYLGIIMALMMELCDSILVAMVIHFTMNGTSTIMAFLSEGILEMTGEVQATDLNEVVSVGMVLVFAGVAIMALGIILVMLHALAGIHGKSLKDVLRKKETDSKIRLMDVWLVLFIIYTLYKCVTAAIG